MSGSVELITLAVQLMNPSKDLDKTRSVAINTSSGNNRLTSLDGIEKRQKHKNESMDLGPRARMTFVATAEIDESEKTCVSDKENVTLEQMKDYLADVLQETKNKKSLKRKKIVLTYIVKMISFPFAV